MDRFRLSLTSDAPPDMVVSVQAGEPPEYCFRVWQFQERAAYDVFIGGVGEETPLRACLLVSLFSYCPLLLYHLLV